MIPFASSDKKLASAALVAPLSLSDTVYNFVRNEIMEGKHQPGAALRQDDIAARLGVSKIPLREAFSRLESEGLVVLRPRKGYSVASFDLSEIAEIFELRALIEAHAGRLSAACHTPEDEQRVSQLAEEMAQLDRSAPDYHDHWCHLNREFHGVIIEASQNRHTIRLAMQLRDAIEPYVRLDTTMSEDDSAADYEHRQIAQAFAARNDGLVGALIAAHCYHTRDRLMSSLKAQLGTAA